MGLFGDKESEKIPDSTQSLGSGNKDIKPSLAELEAGYLEKHGITPKGKRGRKPKSDSVQDELTKALFKPEIWTEVAALPFNIRKAMTGSEIFDLNDDQKKALGTPLSLMMQLLIEIDPKYLALAAFSINLTTIWAEKEIEFSMQKRKESKSAKT
jgi:hypothetical protein